MENLTRLDSYDYLVLPGVVRIKIISSSDPILVDILSEISNSNDLFYLDGRYYNFLEDYAIVEEESTNEWFLELSVIEVIPSRIGDVLDNLNNGR